MRGWIAIFLKAAGWRAFSFSLALWLAYCWWAFRAGGVWARVVEAGGGVLPEMKPGFPPIEPQRTLDSLNSADAAADYLCWQAADLPYALGSMIVFSLAAALALKSLRLEKSILRFLLAPPLVYMICEAIENALLAVFASGLADPVESLVLVQQAATTVKLASGLGSLFVAVIALAAALAAAAVRLVRSRR